MIRFRCKEFPFFEAAQLAHMVKAIKRSASALIMRQWMPLKTANNISRHLYTRSVFINKWRLLGFFSLPRWQTVQCNLDLYCLDNTQNLWLIYKDVTYHLSFTNKKSFILFFFQLTSTLYCPCVFNLTVSLHLF